MSETVEAILRDAFEDIVVSVDEAALESSDAQTGIRIINRIMHTLAANGADYDDYVDVDSVDDEVLIDDGAVDALVSVIALRLWPKYRKGSATQEVLVNARNGIKQLYKLKVTLTESQFPGILPVGSGHMGNETGPFYSGVDEEAAELAAAILLE
jgi:hypothetical protein